jgi:hypothetical protein
MGQSPISAIHTHGGVLYHFDQVFMIFEISVSEKTDKLSFDLWQILKVAFFLAVTRD